MMMVWYKIENNLKYKLEPKKSANSSSSREKPAEAKEKRINQEDVKKFGYEINLSFRVKGLTFDTLQNVKHSLRHKMNNFLVQLGRRSSKWWNS